jgi:hypothetical protein
MKLQYSAAWREIMRAHPQGGANEAEKGVGKKE